MISSRLSRFVFLAAAAALAGLLAASGAEAQTTVKQAAQAKLAKPLPRRCTRSRSRSIRTTRR